MTYFENLHLLLNIPHIKDPYSYRLDWSVVFIFIFPKTSGLILIKYVCVKIYDLKFGNEGENEY